MHKVLIVENNPTLIALLSHFFEAEGCEIRLADDGLQAIMVLESFTPDILFTDIIMPKISGDQLCRIVRQTPRLKDVFIVIYSAIAYEDEPQLYDLNADFYIAKGSQTLIKDHIRLLLDRLATGKRQEKFLHGKETLQRRSVTKELLVIRRHYHAMMENLAEAVIEMDCAGRILNANRGAQELLGRGLPALLSSRLTDHLAGTELSQVEQWLADVSTAAPPQYRSSYDFPLETGEHRVVLKLVRISEQEESFIIAILQDVTLQKLTERKLVEKVDELDAVMDSIDHGVLFMDAGLRARLTNRAFRDMWGMSEEFMAGQPTFRQIISFNRHRRFYDVPDDAFERYLDARENAVKKGAIGPQEFHRKDGLVYQYQCVVLPDGGRMLTYFDITKLKNTQKQLANTLEEVHQLAHRDPLTGLSNLRMLQERFLSTASISRRKGWKAAVMFIDIDGFKTVNDSYGHEIGDMTLKMAAERLLQIMRSADTVCRIGGDEFLIIQTEVDDQDAAASVAERILCHLSEPFELSGHSVRIGASIGISIYPTHGDNLDDLMKMADEAMYQTKARGKQSYTFFQPPGSR